MGMSSPLVSGNPVYEAVSPMGIPSNKVAAITPRPASLEGKRIGLVCNGFTCSDLLLEALSDLLGKQINGLEFIKLPSGKTESWGTEPQDGTTGDVAKEAGVDAVIVAAGG